METQAVINTELQVPEDKMRATTAVAEMKGAATQAKIDAAYAKFMSMPKGTPEYNEALGDFVSLLFPNKPD